MLFDLNLGPDLASSHNFAPFRTQFDMIFTFFLTSHMPIGTAHYIIMYTFKKKHSFEKFFGLVVIVVQRHQNMTRVTFHKKVEK